MKITTQNKILFCNHKIIQKRLLRGITAVLLSAIVVTGTQTPIALVKAESLTKVKESFSDPVNSSQLNRTARDEVQKSSNLRSRALKQSHLTAQVRKTVLENGLTILTKEVHSAPVVTMQVWYKVGSRDEAPGEKGVAHLLEHMLFRGTKKRPVKFSNLFAALGSEFNAFTTREFTSYFANVESNKLDALLVLEADRMENSIIDENELAEEKKIVIAEIQGTENNPYYRLYNSLMKAGFPNQSYGMSATKSDIEKITAEQVRNFYRQNYRPDNAFLVIVGDFKTEPTLKKIQEVFGKIPSVKQINGEKSSRITGTIAPKTANTDSSKVIIRREPGGFPSVGVVYPLPERNHPDLPALLVVDYILTYGQNSYLRRALISLGLADNVMGDQTIWSDGGSYILWVTTNSDRQLESIEKVIQSAIAYLQTEGVTTEQVNTAKRQIQGNYILKYRDIHSQGTLLGYNQALTGDYRYPDLMLAAIDRVSTADVQRVVNKYLNPNNRTVGFLKPTQKTKRASNPKNINFDRTTEDFLPKKPFSLAEVAQYLPSFPPPSNNHQQPIPEQLTLPNGLQVLLLPDSSSPSVSLSGFIRAGQEFEPREKVGLAALTAMKVSITSISRTRQLESRKGIVLKLQPDPEGVKIYGVSIAENLPFLMENLADFLQYPTFKTVPLEFYRESYLTILNAINRDPGLVAEQTFAQAIYPENHPLHHVPTEATLKAITEEDIVNFHQTYYRPDRTILALVGDFNPSEVKTHLKTVLGYWQSSDNKLRSDLPPVSPPDKALHLRKVVPGQTQSLIIIGYPITLSNDSQFYATLILNNIIAGNPLCSRLGSELRYRQGLTYKVQSNFHSTMNSRVLAIRMQTMPKYTKKVISSTLKVLENLQEQGVTKGEVETAKQSLISSYKLSLTDPDMLASIIVNNHISGNPPEFIRQIPNDIQRVTWEEVNQVAKNLFDPDKMIVVTVDGD